jgi:hypothetical protein
MIFLRYGLVVYRRCAAAEQCLSCRIMHGDPVEPDFSQPVWTRLSPVRRWQEQATEPTVAAVLERVGAP